MHLHQELEGFYLGIDTPPEWMTKEYAMGATHQQHAIQSYEVPVHGCAGGLLIVEDFDGIRALLAHHFQRHGYGVCSSATVRDALHIARDEQPRIVIVDYDMTGEDVNKAIAKLRTALPDSYIVLMGGPGTSDVEHRALFAGASTVLAKAYRISELDRIVDAAQARFDHKAHIAN
jgi:DNA-binding response OmpR family regulator